MKKNRNGTKYILYLRQFLDMLLIIIITPYFPAIVYVSALETYNEYHLNREK